ncbi:uncharacterized protein Pyn_13671 [Prunus yedoensis var. nudiflora]|uniref:Uncharacterized protein n=1 Tax=Prunus yedoensis var. nudiflora TaxID=2094558 RepID=A0A314YHU6_PRUYE|nr:uncharacterized protein Pyn_13671 [Prunus yedoensis var. nudiflora]
MNEEEEEKIVVKLTVSVSKDIVCYAEAAGEDFANLLLSFLTVPLGFIVKRMRDASFKGCIYQLHKCVKDLDEHAALVSNILLPLRSILL